MARALLIGFIAFLSGLSALFGQGKMGVSPTEQDDPFLFHQATYSNLNRALDSNDLDGAFNNLLNDLLPGKDFQFNYFIQSPGGYHVQFRQLGPGKIPVFDAYVKFNLDKDFVVRSMLNMTFDADDWQTTIPASVSFSSLGYENPIVREEGPVWLVLPGKNIAEWTEYAKVENAKTHDYELFVFDDKGLVVRRDLNCYLPDSQISARVFNPDPLTTAQQPYGGLYVDDNDADNIALNDERQNLIVEVTYNNGVFSPGNDYVVISEHSAPTVQPVTTTQGFFSNTRSESGFEDLNVLYHITLYQRYMQSLGFSNLVNYPIPVDAHALSGQDNSMFSSSTNPPRLFFGEGGVDDAEDADVVIHEYGHAISYSAAPGSNSGFERTALDEGFGDYLATSYSRHISSYRWDDMFTWDGHNEYWVGRDAETAKKYPAGLNGSIHSNGEIWNTALMEIWEEMGRDSTDRLVLQSMYGYGSAMNFYAAAQLLLQADTLIYDGKNFCSLYPILLNRGLIEDTVFPDPCTFFDPSIAVFAGRDTTICLGASVRLGGSPTSDIGNLINWSPAPSLDDPTAFNPIAMPSDTTLFTVVATDGNGFFNSDAVRVFVRICPDEPTLANTLNFATGSGDLKVILPVGEDQAEIWISDPLGRLVYQGQFSGANNFTIPLQDPAAGVYVIRVKTGNKKAHSLKAVRFTK